MTSLTKAMKFFGLALAASMAGTCNVLAMDSGVPAADPQVVSDVTMIVSQSCNFVPAADTILKIAGLGSPGLLLASGIADVICQKIAQNPAGARSATLEVAGVPIEGRNLEAAAPTDFLVSSSLALIPQKRFTLDKETGLDPNNPVDPEGIWKTDEMKDTQTLYAPPKVVTYKLDEPEGEYILSILVNSQCSTDSCPMRNVFVKPDGTKELKSAGMALFSDPVASDLATQEERKALNENTTTENAYYLSEDGTTILGIPEIIERLLRGETAAALTQAGIPQNCSAFAERISASEGSFKTISSKGCLGAFQFCPGTFERYYKGRSDAFLNNPADQVSAWLRYTQVQWYEADKGGLTSVIGQRVCSGEGKCAKVDDSSILMACQFGCGGSGKLANFVKGKDCNAANVKDGFGTSVCTYLVRGAGFDVSCMTGRAATVAISEEKPNAETTVPPGQSAVPLTPALNPNSLYVELITADYTMRIPVNVPPQALRNLLDAIKRR